MARPGRPLEPVDEGLPVPVLSWTATVRRVVFGPLMSGDRPLTLKDIAQRLLAMAPPEAKDDKPGAAGAKRLGALRSGRSAASVQRMIQGLLVPTRDVVFDLLRIVEEERGVSQRHDLEELWAAYKPALRTRLPDVYEVYEVVDGYASARLLVGFQQQEITRLEKGLEQHRRRAARTDEQLKRARRAQAVHRQALRSAGQETDRLRMREQHLKHELNDASGEVARLRQDVATARAQVEHWQEQAEWHLREKEEVRQESATEREAWQEREALLLERLAQACETLQTAAEQAAAVEEALRARETHWRDQAQAGHAAASSARADADAARGQAAVARAEAEAAREEATRVLNAQRDRADALVAAVGAEQEQAQQTISRLEEELRQAQIQLRAAQQNAVHQDAQLTSFVAERALNADLDDIFSQVLAQHKELGSRGPAWIDARPEAIHIPSSKDQPSGLTWAGDAAMAATPAQPKHDVDQPDSPAEPPGYTDPDAPVAQDTTAQASVTPGQAIRLPAAESGAAHTSPPSPVVRADAPQDVGTAAVPDETSGPHIPEPWSVLSAPGTSRLAENTAGAPRNSPRSMRKEMALASYRKARRVAGRAPEWLKLTLGALSVVCVLVGAMGVFFGGMFWVVESVGPLKFQKGDRPKAADEDVSVHDFEWTLSPSQKEVTATFTHFSAFASYDDFKGVLEQSSSKGCAGARVEWGLRINGSAADSGVLTEQLRKHRMREHASTFPGSVTLTLRRTDNEPCSILIHWEDPYFYKPALDW
ncbi:hypothetical protein [Streptomyces sp. NPDC046832]|uniref:hypothetical protein n=1 Tax=Streptomyces sp. NPDC046832 TaxID=3155020 RepID=UPI0033CC4130